MKRKSVLLIVVALFLFSCEPTDWHYILDDPSDLDNVVFVDNSPVDITVNYTIPFQEISAVRDEVELSLYMTYSEVGSDVIQAFSDTYNLSYQPGTAGSVIFSSNPPAAGNYIFTIYVLDENGKPSQGVPSDPIIW
jgi:hypothetical protein